MLSTGTSVLVELQSPSVFDKLIASTSNLSPTSLLQVSAIGGFTPVAGAAFDLLDWTTSTVGTFGTIQLPTLTQDLRWNTSGLYTDGSISVEKLQVPLPPVSLLLPASALAASGVRRSRTI